MLCDFDIETRVPITPRVQGQTREEISVVSAGGEHKRMILTVAKTGLRKDKTVSHAQRIANSNSLLKNGLPVIQSSSLQVRLFRQLRGYLGAVWRRQKSKQPV